MSELQHVQSPVSFATLLPDAARRYLAHTTDGRPIRDIAREAGCHASTVLRQVRKTESMRDDPLVDKALSVTEGDDVDSPCSDAVLDAAATALRDLCKPGAMMLYTVDVSQPAIVQTTGEGDACVLSTLTLAIAAALVMRGWIAQDGGTGVKRYKVTPDGRASLPALVATRDRRASRDMESVLDDFSDHKPDRRSRDRTQANGPGSESPLMALARRRGSDGQPFLSSEHLAAGDRLQEDFAISDFAKTDLLGWETPDSLNPLYARANATEDHRRKDATLRTLDAVRDLGPGLSDVVVRCCCLREGLEATEKRMGWSARSGKVVLRIALQRLSLFYATTLSKEGVLIG
ncbi:DUF6456 domain-containing protein [Marivita hallyeonensis]|uniref:DUF6456 domain-containing protein n=1 Tax=Marivita hallyeonensis TaxID=996342 RepID=A0A1M5R5U2_9RHOB|nr:DUF6456 domain-containing protein [Marivita hallyeonensis]SHH21702.1 hypothetical protein SAMN05443551_1632 [Marivita hallyeonensis]